MEKKQIDKKEEFLQSVKEQLYFDTFQADPEDSSYERIEALVKILDLEEGVDEEALEKSQADFTSQFKKNIEQNQKKDSRKYWRRFSRTAAAVLAIVLAANMTSQAVMNESLFHMVLTGKNHVEIIPSKDMERDVNYSDNATIHFDTVDDFAAYFGESFWFCSWLPDGVELEEILFTKSGNLRNYTWIYTSSETNKKIGIAISERTNNDIAGLTGTEIKNMEPFSFRNGLKGSLGVSQGEWIAGFEYGGWWYLLHMETDEETFREILKGMRLYE